MRWCEAIADVVGHPGGLEGRPDVIARLEAVDQGDVVAGNMLGHFPAIGSRVVEMTGQRVVLGLGFEAGLGVEAIGAIVTFEVEDVGDGREARFTQKGLYHAIGGGVKALVDANFRNDVLVSDKTGVHEVSVGWVVNRVM
ncbi:MAG TPA: hypothetical protein VLF67_04455 [Candidatus Saccharimonas sp.]|nr:hypothetical protein [Candidatus Saccharimonas sp.]